MSKNNNIFFGFAMSDTMFTGDCDIERKGLTPDQAKEIIEAGVIPCLNPSHVATIVAAKERYGISVEIPETPPKVSLGSGDSIIVMQVRGLPRLTDRHEYSEEEISSAVFTFSMYTVH